MKKITLFLCMCLSTLFSFAQTIGIQSYATGFSNPVEVVNAGDNRLFVVQKTGAIKIVKPSGSAGVVNAANFLTLTTATIINGDERGLLGLAFHPNYATNGYFYVNYTRTGDGATVVARYSVSADPDVADAASGQVLLTVAQPFSNHNGGTLRFGPDGYLYIGMGDGGSGGDPGNRAQDITENLGKMLRIDVDGPFPYGIPPSNPFVGIAGNDEIWATGLRNPWKFSFNRLNGDLWIGDVGQGEVEEINQIASPLPVGLNFGWRCYEGNDEYDTSGCGAAALYTFPLIDYLQSETDGCAVTGGYYYTGSLYPNFNGKYIFGDYCLNKIFTLTDAGVLTISPAIPGLNGLTTFGQDINGELYVIGGTTLYRIKDTSLSTGDFASNGFSLYPNPAASEIFIRNTNAAALAQFSLYDLSGKLLMQQPMNDAEINAIPTGSLQSGLYMITIQDNAGARFSTKVAIR